MQAAGVSIVTVYPQALSLPKGRGPSHDGPWKGRTKIVAEIRDAKQVGLSGLGWLGHAGFLRLGRSRVLLGLGRAGIPLLAGSSFHLCLLLCVEVTYDARDVRL